MDFQSNRFYHIISYGCQANMSDSEHYAGQLEELGYHHTEDLDTADVILINTCCVRETAEDKTLGKIGELKHLKTQNPDLIIAVTGCMAQEWQDKLFKRAPHIDLVIGTHNIHKLIELIQERRSKADHYMAADMSLPAFHDMPVKRFQKFFAWIPIMNGCNKFCTYCIVPYVRGREVSRPIDAIVEEIKKVAAEGYKEITLLGQNVNSYGKTLETLCSALVNKEPEKIGQIFGDYLWNTISIRDTAAARERKENFYHGILLGLLGYKSDWLIKSNAESGTGYSDILIEVPDNRTGIVIELKYAENGDMDAACEAALEQIEEKDYIARLKQDGMRNFIRYGIACFKKDCRVVVDQNSEM